MEPMANKSRVVTIVADGESYPCTPTKGAWLLFRELTGREVSQIRADSLTDLFTYLYWCVKAGCRRQGVDLGHTLEGLADMCDASEVIAWGKALSDGVGDEGVGGEKKSPSAS